MVQEDNFLKNNNKACCAQERESKERLCDWTIWSSFLSPDNHHLSLSLEVRTVGLKGQDGGATPYPDPLVYLQSSVFQMSQNSFPRTFLHWRPTVPAVTQPVWNKGRKQTRDRAELELPAQSAHTQKNDGCSRLGWGRDSAHWEKSAFLWASIHLSIKWEIITLAVLIINLK